MRKAFKTLYLSLGIIYIATINYLSFFIEPYSLVEPMYLKVILSLVSLLLFSFVYILLIKPTLIFKKPLSAETIISLYIGVIIIPLIGLYY